MSRNPLNRAREQQPERVRTSVLHTTLGVGAVALLVLAIVAACGGNKNKGIILGTRTNNPASPQVVRATFTATIEGATPPREQTKAAVIAAATQTAASGPPASPTQAGPIVTTATATIPANAVRPPSAQLSTSSGTADGAIGNFNYYDPAKDTGYQGTQPYVQLPDSGAQLASGLSARVTISTSPYAVESADVKIYTYEHNTAIPQDASGNIIGKTLAFFPQTDATQTLTLTGADLTFTPNVPPGRYIVSIDVHWLVPDSLPSLKGVLHTQYVFNLEVL